MRTARSGGAGLGGFCINLTKSAKIISMIKPENTISAVRRSIQDCFNKQVTVKLNLGRNKFVTFPASVSGIYPSIFTVEPLDKNFLGKTAYSYSEILCGKVLITPNSEMA